MAALRRKMSRLPLFRRLLKYQISRKLAYFKQLEDQRKLSDPRNLRNFEKKIFSQNGEDGIIQEIYRRIGTTNKIFMEFGVENGQECNTRYLLQDHGWSGTWIDCSSENIHQATRQFSNFPIKLIKEFITKENIVSIFKQAQVPEDLDLLSIDIDGNDYWVWLALRDYHPRVVIIEYNASYLPHEKWIMPYNPTHVFTGTNYFGASLKALAELGMALGYTLVACDSRGVNAFFVRNDRVTPHFTGTDKEVEYHYCAPKYKRLFFGYPPR